MPPMGRVVSHLDALLREAASLMQDVHDWLVR